MNKVEIGWVIELKPDIYFCGSFNVCDSYETTDISEASMLDRKDEKILERVKARYNPPYSKKGWVKNARLIKIKKSINTIILRK